MLRMNSSRQAVQWLQDPTLFSRPGQASVGVSCRHTGILMLNKAGEAKSIMDFRTLVEKVGGGVPGAIRRMYDQVWFKDKNLHVTWMDN
jgi:hypothetical protein